MTQYLKRSAYNGAPEPDELVDQGFVDRFIGAQTLEFFRDLGGTEEVTATGNVIKVKSVSPDGATTRITTFEKVEEQ